MSERGFGTYALMATVVLWGVLLGGIVFSNAIVMPVFLADLPASASVVTGPHAVNEVPFWMSIHPLIVLSLIVALIANWRVTVRRRSIAIVLVCYIVALIVTALFFVPELIAFQASPQSSISASEWASRAMRWQILSWIRGGIMFLLILPLLWALTSRGENAADAQLHGNAITS